MNIGQWVHLSQIIPFIHHFLSRLCFLLQHSEKKRKVEINKYCKADLHFLQFALKKCQDRVDLNAITYRCPTHAYQSNSCPAGLGGYSNKGFPWRFFLELKYQSRASNNLLEHIAALITSWVNIIAGRLTHGNCLLSMTDSMTSEGWLKKTNFIDDGEEPIQATICLKVACLHASQYLLHGIREYSQWFCSANNTVANALSRDTTGQTKNSPESFVLTAPHRFQNTSKLYPFPAK
jgi:hypothetical protein